MTFPLPLLYTDRWTFPLPAGHRFPADKYRLARHMVEDQNWAVSTQPAPRVTADELRLAHDNTFAEAFCGGTLDANAMRRIGFPWSPELVERTLRSCGATVAATRKILAGQPRAAYLAGGTHHAHRDFGAGYCVFNDVAVAARIAQQQHPTWRVLVIDTDVHQGDGTAAIFEHDPSVFTLSLHGARNFPSRKQRSDLDVPLADGTGDRDYLIALDRALDEALDRAAPELVFWLAGADPWEGDTLGRMAVTRTGLAERNHRVVARCGATPLVTVMGGGYASDPSDTAALYCDIVESLL